MDIRLKRILPERMWQLRNRRKLSLEDVAHLTGLSKSTVQCLESGQSLTPESPRGPHLLTVAEVGRVLATTPDGLLGFAPYGYHGEDGVVIHSALAERCDLCGILLLAGRSHVPRGGECILECWHAGINDEELATRFGHTTDSIRIILEQEIELRRRRPLIPVFSDERKPLLGFSAAIAG